MPTLGNFRQYSENDVLNLFRYAGDYPVNKGTFVKIGASGWTLAAQPIDIDTVAAVGQTYTNTVSTRWSVPPFVMPVTDSGDATIGMLLYDGKETDENGEKLLYNPRKAAEMGVFISGQAAPVVSKGVFLYSGVGGTVTAGNKAYLHINGGISTSGGGTTTATQVGVFLGPKDINDYVLVKLTI